MPRTSPDACEYEWPRGACRRCLRWREMPEGRCRACRPPAAVFNAGCVAAAQPDREARIRRYAARAACRQPLFD